ncbi:unnamed protein product [Rangifer tarandus platyrhynchus]|uniref:Uncharacterized protein n=1 Tax=Rangifer tarandus platyrhynchus TaxID=3082113 RepID=A0ABN8XZQ3_RANTA|nr:unnamed protein product [Rangifer tarandus platyrhynchus]
MSDGGALLEAAASQSGREGRGGRNRTAPRRPATSRKAPPTPQRNASPSRVPSNQARTRACAHGPPSPARLQVRSRFRPAFAGRKLQGPRMRFGARLQGPTGPSRLQVIPPLPRRAGPIERRQEGFSSKRPRPRGARGAYRLVGPAGAGARFPLGGGGARAAEASAEAAAAFAVAAAAEAGRAGSASPPAAPPVRPSVPPREEPAERGSARRHEPRPPLCRCL